MKLRHSIFFVCSILLLSACQEVTTIQPIENDIPTLEEDEQQVEQEKTPIETIKEDVLYSWEVQDGEQTAELYLVADGGTTEEGGKQYNGNLAFYLGDDTYGVLQEHLAGDLEAVSINLDKSPFKIHTFGDQTMITWINPEAANSNTLTMWTYTDGEMQPVTFDSDARLVITGDQVKFIEGHYLQTYIYNNGSDESEGIGWFYTTWQWNAAEHDFATYAITQYIQDDMYGWESGEYNTKLWHENEAEYISFPHITLTNDFLESIKKGMLLDNSFRLGDSIDKVLEKSSDYLHHDYYEGGIYYAFPGGSSYFYDESTRKITFITLNGGLITNDIDSIISILGEPADSGYDDIERTNYAFFYFGEYRLKVDSTESGKLTGFWLTVQ
ncbi:hypothetical protein [Sporosarcina sp. FSL K6-3457]|uniref:hypothetical protein n=1 Tax=Sporosarcina sp. FSL K6-3457 TaxID=2978204 RepID=UPI0030FA0590